MSIQEPVGKHDYPNTRRWGQPKRTYYDGSVRSFYLTKGGSAEIRILSFNFEKTEEFYVKSAARKGKSGASYTPGKYIPAVGGLPGFDGRCIVTHLGPKVEGASSLKIFPSTKSSFEIFDFRPYHVILRDTGKYTQVKHALCKSQGPRPNPEACPLCQAGEKRIIGGPRILSLTKSQRLRLLNHEAHIMQLPFSEDPQRFSGMKVRSLGAYCENCGAEAYSEAMLRSMSEEQVVARVCQGDYHCTDCGHRGKLRETLTCDGEDVVRGQITYKNIEVKKEAASGDKTRMIFNSDLLPFERLPHSMYRLRYPEFMYNEAMARLKVWDLKAQAAPYGINPEEFKDRERYVQVVTNSQLRDVNWVVFGQDREKYYKNPFFS